MVTKTRAKPQIDKAQIVEEALKLLKETNLNGVTMRILADRLGIRAASLYWYFPNKAALISTMSEELFVRAIEKVPDAENWQDWMRGVGHSVWYNLIDYPDSGLLIMTADLNEEQFDRTTSVVREKLASFDIDPADAFRLHSGIQALITGWVTLSHSPSVKNLESEMDMKQAAFETLDAMIDGWSRIAK